MSRYFRVSSENDKASLIDTPSAASQAARVADQPPVHWLNPVLLLSTFSSAVFLALAHHLVYNYFDDKVLSSNMDSQYQQKLISRVGTALAFLVKATLTVTISIVFSQQFWLSLGKKAERISDIDAISSVRGNILQLFRVQLWFRQWILAGLAVLMWCIPIVSIFTPGTIHVEPAVYYNISRSNNQSLHASPPGAATIYDTNVYNTRQVPQLQQSWLGASNFSSVNLTQFENGTQLYEYRGPSGPMLSVTLGSLSSLDILPIADVDSTFQNVSYDLSFFGPALKCSVAGKYFLETYSSSLSIALREGYLPSPDLAYLVQGLRYNAWVDSSEHNIERPNWSNHTDNKNNLWPFRSSSTNTYWYYFFDSRKPILLVCSLWNASYDASFWYGTGDQIVNASVIEYLHPTPYDPVFVPSRGKKVDFGRSAYNSILSVFNSVVMGSVTYSTSTITTESNKMLADDLHYFGGTPAATALRPIFERKNGVQLHADDLIRTLEAMFRNVTLSIMANPDLRDQSPSFVPVDTWRSVLIFRYNPWELIIAYGCAILATLLCVLWGMYLMYIENRASFDISFSTILRATQGEDFDWIMRSDYRAGECPLPEKLGEVKLRYRGRQRARLNEENDDGEGFKVVD